MSSQHLEHLLTLASLPGGAKLSELHQAGQEHGVTWTLAQLRLSLACLSVQVGEGDDPMVSVEGRSEREVLASAILEVVRAQGGQPIPAARVKELLPDRLAAGTSVEQIRALAREIPELLVFGPGLLRMKG